MTYSIKRLINHTAIYGLSSIVGRFLNYLLVPLHTNVFATDEFGILSYFYAYICFILIILSLQFETGYFRFVNLKISKSKVYNNSILPVIITAFVFIVLIFGFTSPLAVFLNVKNHPEYVRWFALIIAIDAITSIPFAKLRQEGKAIKFALIKILNIAINILVNLYFLLLCPYLIKIYDASISLPFYDPGFGIGYVIIANLSASLFTLILLSREIFCIQLQIDFLILKKLIIFSLPLIISGLTGMVNETLDRILLDYFLVPPENVTDRIEYVMGQIGIYSANYKVAVFMTLFIQTFRYAADPFFFSNVNNDNSKITYANVMLYFIACGIMIFLGIMFFIDIVKYFIGEEYREGINIVPILLLANLFLGIIYNLSFWYKLSNKTRFSILITLVGALITIFGNIILIPRMGYIGSAWTTLFCYFAMMLLSYFLGRKHFRIPYNIKKIVILFGIGMVLFYLHSFINFQRIIINYSFKLFLLLVYGVACIFVLNLRQIFKKSILS